MRDNLGEFIKEQRGKNNISQNKLAELLFVDRTLISKWENGKATPCMNELVKMAELFSISIEEFISTEIYNKNNKEEIKNNLNNYLIKQDNKIIKLHKYFNSSVIFILLVISIFFGYYFYNTFNKIVVYRVTGESENYNLNTGILFMTNSKSYFKIDNFDKNIDEIEIYIIYNNDRITIYKGTPDSVKIDIIGYNTFINIKNFNKYKDKVYLDILYNNKTETIKLDFRKDFINDQVVFNAKDNNDRYDKKEDEIPKFIRDNFTKENELYKYKENNMEINYNISNNNLYIINKNETIEFNIIYKYMYISISNKTYYIEYNSTKDTSDENILSKYNYYMKYINKYIGVKE